MKKKLIKEILSIKYNIKNVIFNFDLKNDLIIKYIKNVIYISKEIHFPILENKNIIYIPFSGEFNLFADLKSKSKNDYIDINETYGNIISLHQLNNKLKIINKCLENENLKEKIKYICYIHNRPAMFKFLKNKKLFYDNYNENIVYYFKNLIINCKENIKTDIIIHKFYYLKKQKYVKYFDLDYNLVENNFLDYINLKKKLNENIIIFDEFNFDFVNKRDILLETLSNYLIKENKINNNFNIKVPISFTITNNNNLNEILEKIKNEKLNYPFLIKFNETFNMESHNIILVKNEEGIKEVLKLNEYFNKEFYFQELINHEPYVIKYYYYIKECYQENRDSIGFDFSKLENNYYIFTNSSNFKEIFKNDKINNENYINQKISEENMKYINEVIYKTFKVYIYGVDFIKKCNSNDYYVVDFNYFPSFGKLTNMNNILEQNLNN